MKVYIVESAEGEYEDRCEYVVAAYFDKQKAEDKKSDFNKTLEKANKQYDKCLGCPINNNDFKTSEYLQFNIDKLKEYCSQAELKSEHLYYRCKNCHNAPKDKKAWIEEMDVIE